MTFIPGSHQRNDLRAIDLTDAHDMFAAAPGPGVRAAGDRAAAGGDCTFHNGYLAHTANPNNTDEFRYAMVNIYIDAETRYSGAGHVCTDHLGLTAATSSPTTSSPASERWSQPLTAPEVIPATICRLKKMYITSGGIVINKMLVNSRFHWLRV